MSRSVHSCVLNFSRPRDRISRTSDFDIWIGDPEENKGWEWLKETRHFLVERIAHGVGQAQSVGGLMLIVPVTRVRCRRRSGASRVR